MPSIQQCNVKCFETRKVGYNNPWLSNLFSFPFYLIEAEHNRLEQIWINLNAILRLFIWHICLSSGFKSFLLKIYNFWLTLWYYIPILLGILISVSTSGRCHFKKSCLEKVKSRKCWGKHRFSNPINPLTYYSGTHTQRKLPTVLGVLRVSVENMEDRKM